MNCYVDTSVVLRSLLNQKAQFADWAKIRKAVSSVLLLVECHRVLDRCRLEAHLSDAEVAELKQNLRVFLRGLTLCQLDQSIIERASEPFSTIVGSLDALHLSTALLWQQQRKEKLLFLTFDDQLRTAAIACGFEIAG